jgi:hypothetical protein
VLELVIKGVHNRKRVCAVTAFVYDWYCCAGEADGRYTWWMPLLYLLVESTSVCLGGVVREKHHILCYYRW